MFGARKEMDPLDGCVNGTNWVAPLHVAYPGPHCINEYFIPEYDAAANATIDKKYEEYVTTEFANETLRVQLAYPEWAHTYNNFATGEQADCRWWAVGTDKTLDLPYVGPDNFTKHDFCPLFKEGCFAPLPERSGPYVDYNTSAVNPNITVNYGGVIYNRTCRERPALCQTLRRHCYHDPGLHPIPNEGELS